MSETEKKTRELSTKQIATLARGGTRRMVFGAKGLIGSVLTRSYFKLTEKERNELEEIYKALHKVCGKWDNRSKLIQLNDERN